jgi:glycine/D-amino acid oxidase-like deaminating enzyme
MAAFRRVGRAGVGRGVPRQDFCDHSGTPQLPDTARVVVVGGGVIGTSVLYHLASAGWKDVVLLEQNQMTSGTTWHAAGLMVTYGSMSETSTELRKYTKQLYSDLEEETGLSTGFSPCGFIEVATDKHYLEEYRRTAAFNRYCDIDVHEITPNEVQDLFPLARTDDILAGFYVPTDGRVNPVDCTMAMAKGARNKGAKIYENVTVSGVTKDPTGSRVTGVNTADGQHIKAEFVVNCAGMWARQFGELAGVNVPNQVHREQRARATHAALCCCIGLWLVVYCSVDNCADLRQISQRIVQNQPQPTTTNHNQPQPTTTPPPRRQSTTTF